VISSCLQYHSTYSYFCSSSIFRPLDPSVRHSGVERCRLTQVSGYFLRRWYSQSRNVLHGLMILALNCIHDLFWQFLQCLVLKDLNMTLRIKVILSVLMDEYFVSFSSFSFSFFITLLTLLEVICGSIVKTLLWKSWKGFWLHLWVNAHNVETSTETSTRLTLTLVRFSQCHS